MKVVILLEECELKVLFEFCLIIVQINIYRVFGEEVLRERECEVIDWVEGGRSRGGTPSRSTCWVKAGPEGHINSNPPTKLLHHSMMGELTIIERSRAKQTFREIILKVNNLLLNIKY